MTDHREPAFDPAVFFSKINGGRTVVEYFTDQAIYRQGEASDSVFYIQSGQVKIVVLSEQGKEAVIAVLDAGAFFGEGCLAGQARRLSTATALSDCMITQIALPNIIRMIHDEPAFAELFIAHLLKRNA